MTTGRLQGGGWNSMECADGRASLFLPRSGETEATCPYAPGLPMPGTGLGSLGCPDPKASAPSSKREKKDLFELLEHSEYVCFGSGLICISLLI